METEQENLEIACTEMEFEWKDAQIASLEAQIREMEAKRGGF